jgi:hypothetical protein
VLRSLAQTGDGDDPTTQTRGAADPQEWEQSILDFFNEVAKLKRADKQTAASKAADAQAALQIRNAAMNVICARGKAPIEDFMRLTWLTRRA